MTAPGALIGGAADLAPSMGAGVPGEARIIAGVAGVGNEGHRGASALRLLGFCALFALPVVLGTGCRSHPVAAEDEVLTDETGQPLSPGGIEDESPQRRGAGRVRRGEIDERRW